MEPLPLFTGPQILSACAATYQSLREFKGGAAVISLSLLQTGDVPATMLIKNADANFDFVLDRHFNITGHDTTHRPFEITSTTEKTTETWHPGGKKQTSQAENIEMAVAAFTGVAAGAPTTIPALLLSTDWGFPFTIEAEPTLKGSEVFSGRECYIVTQRVVTRPKTLTLWIDAKTFLLRGMREEMGASSFAVDIPVGAPMNNSAPQQMQVKVIFSNHMHIFSVVQTVPSEAELEISVQKLIDTPPLDAAVAGH